IRTAQGPTALLVRFDLAQRRLLLPGAAAPGGLAPRTTGLPIEGWEDTTSPTLAGKPLPLEPYETSRSLAISANGSAVSLGSEWAVRVFEADGRQRWRTPTPGVAWLVNLSADGRFVVAALGDGTIRWYRTRDEGTAQAGSEALALFVHSDLKRWILWTPEGFYDASEGGAELFGYHQGNAAVVLDVAASGEQAPAVGTPGHDAEVAIGDGAGVGRGQGLQAGPIAPRHRRAGRNAPGDAAAIGGTAGKDRILATGGGVVEALGGPEDPALEIGVDEQGQGLAAGLRFALGAGAIPADRAITEGGHHKAAIGAEVHQPGDAGCGGAPTLAAIGLEDPHRPLTAKREGTAVGADRQAAGDFVLLQRQGLAGQGGVGGVVPALDRQTGGAGRQAAGAGSPQQPRRQHRPQRH
ncbi:MAG: hypothetical protein ACKOPS_18040, partial [Cyanobium sp.]